MSFLNWVKEKILSVPLFVTSFGSSVGSLFSNRRTEEYYRGWVYAAVTTIAEEVSEIQLKLVRKKKDGTKEIIPSHPAIDLIRNPNDFFTKKELFIRLQSFKELKGYEYWLVERDGRGKPFAIYPLRPNSIEPLLDPHEYIAGYKYSMGGTTYNIPKENIVHFKSFNPKSDIEGMSTLEAALISVQTDEATKQYNQVFFENNAAPGVILSYPTKLTQDQIDKMKQQWDSEFKGFKRGYRTAVMAGGLKIDKTDVSHNDMQFIEQRKLNRDEILSIFKVPKTILGVTEDVNFASAKTAQYVFARYTVKPKMTAIVDTLNEFFLPMFGEDGLEFEFLSPVQDDVTEKIAYYQSGFMNGWLTPNEIRRAENLPELEDGDNAYLPFSLTPYSKPVVKKVQETARKTLAREMAEAICKLVPAETKPIPAEKKNLSIDVELDRIGEGKVGAMKARAQSYEKLFAATSMSLFNDQKARAIKSVESQFKMAKAKKITVLDEDYEIDVTIDLFSPLFKDYTEKEGQEALKLIGLDAEDFDIDSPDMREFLKKNTKKFAGEITAKTSNDLRALITAGLEQGEAIADLTKRIEDYSGFKTPRAEKIARTETIRASGQAEREAWKESGVVTSIIWYTALDDRVDDLCSLLHGKEVGITETFLSEDDMDEVGVQNYDGAIESPPLHPNCRCTLLPQVSKKSLKHKLTDDEKLQLYLAS